MEYLGVAQFGSVLEWGSRGRRFESSHPDQRTEIAQSFFFFFCAADGSKIILKKLHFSLDKTSNMS